MNDDEYCKTYVTNAVSKDVVGREGMQHVDDGSEPSKQFGIAPLEFVKRSGLFLEYFKNRIGTIAAVDLGGEWVVAEIFPSLLVVLFQGNVEKRLKVGGRGGCIGS